MNFSVGISTFYKPWFKKFVKFAQYLGNHTDLKTQIHLWERHCKFQQTGYYDFSAETFSNYITHILGNIWLDFSCWSGVNVQWIYPGSVSDSKKNLMWLAGLKKNMNSCQLKSSLSSSCQTNNPVFRSWRSY